MKPFDLNTNLEPKPVVVGSPLAIELVPATAWGNNLRACMTSAQWNRIRKNQYRLANHQCEICGQKGTSQGYDWPVECHEVWHYDDVKHIQTLVRLIALCPFCHAVKHFGLTEMRGRKKQATDHLAEVNSWTAKQTAAHIANAMVVWQERSKYVWGLDLSYLLEHGIKTDQT